MFVGISVYRSIHAYTILFDGSMEERPGIHLAESLDGFLLAIVFIIFSIGIGKLFIPENKLFKSIQISWLEPKSFTELKGVLWMAVLTTLVVLFASLIVENMYNLTWNLLVIPGSILLMALALKLLKGSH